MGQVSYLLSPFSQQERDAERLSSFQKNTQSLLVVELRLDTSSFKINFICNTMHPLKCTAGCISTTVYTLLQTSPQSIHHCKQFLMPPCRHPPLCLTPSHITSDLLSVLQINFACSKWNHTVCTTVSSIILLKFIVIVTCIHSVF